MTAMENGEPKVIHKAIHSTPWNLRQFVEVKVDRRLYLTKGIWSLTKTDIKGIKITGECILLACITLWSYILSDGKFGCY